MPGFHYGGDDALEARVDALEASSGSVESSSAPRIVGALGTNLGATQTVTFTGAEEVWLLGVANSASLVVTLASRVAGARCRVIAVHDGTSSARAISFSDGTTPQQAITSSTATALMIGEADCPNATDIGVYSPVGSGGTNGTNGNTVLTTSGAPSSGTGVNGDFAYDPTAKIMYGPKAAGAWPAGVSLAGTNGTNGTNGAISVIEDEGSALTVRSNVNFVGAGVTAADSGGKTVVTIPGGSGSADPSGSGDASLLDLAAATYDLEEGTTTGYGIDGLYGARLRVDKDVAVTSMAVVVTSAGSGFVAGQNMCALWKLDGTLVAKTADQAAVWNSTGAKVMTLTAEAGQTLSLVAGHYIVGIMVNATTRPSVEQFVAGTGTRANFDRTGLNMRTFYKSPVTAIPSPLASTLANTNIPWLGLR